MAHALSLETHAEVDLIVSALAVPVMVADYTPVLEYLRGQSLDRIHSALRTDEGALIHCLTLPTVIAASDEWLRLYGDPLDATMPDLPSRTFTPDAYPALHQTMIRQLMAPFTGVTTIVTEHKVPTITHDRIVRSHWRASAGANGPRYDRIVVVDLDLTDLVGREDRRWG